MVREETKRGEAGTEKRSATSIETGGTVETEITRLGKEWTRGKLTMPEDDERLDSPDKKRAGERKKG